MSEFASYFNLFPDCEAKCTVGVQLPETNTLSHAISSKFLYPSLLLFNSPTVTDFTFLYPEVFAIP